MPLLKTDSDRFALHLAQRGAGSLTWLAGGEQLLEFQMLSDSMAPCEIWVNFTN